VRRDCQGARTNAADIDNALDTTADEFLKLIRAHGPFLAGMTPNTRCRADPLRVGQHLLDDIRRLDIQLTESNMKIAAAVAASSTL
jgi:hypothetical protein